MKAFTYYAEAGCSPDPDLLKLWETSWRRHGWEAVILSEPDAFRADAGLAQRLTTGPLMKSHPNNPVGYTRAALLRWAAMTAVKERAIHLDWDVICNGFRPEDTEKESGFPATFYAGGTCPCAIFASAQGWQFLAAALEFIPLTPAFKPEDLLKDSCDQWAFNIQPKEWATIAPNIPCKLYKEQEGWETAPMIHFATRVTGYQRSRTVKACGFAP